MSAPTTNATSLANLAPRPDRIGALGAARLPAITIEAADLPEDVLALLDHHLLDLGGTYGDHAAGEPIQYDELVIEHDEGVVVRNQHGRRNEAVASPRVSEVSGHGRLTVRQGGVTWPKRSL